MNWLDVCFLKKRLSLLPFYTLLIPRFGYRQKNHSGYLWFILCHYSRIVFFTWRLNTLMGLRGIVFRQMGRLRMRIKFPCGIWHGWSALRAGIVRTSYLSSLDTSHGICCISGKQEGVRWQEDHPVGRSRPGHWCLCGWVICLFNLLRIRFYKKLLSHADYHFHREGNSIITTDDYSERFLISFTT